MVASESLTLGLSVSGGHGRLRSVGGYTDMQGEPDSLFVSAYALWQSGRWQHRLTGCVGVEFGMEFNLPLRAGHGALFADGAAFWEPHGWAIGGVLGYLCPF